MVCDIHIVSRLKNYVSLNFLTFHRKFKKNKPQILIKSNFLNYYFNFPLHSFHIFLIFLFPACQNMKQILFSLYFILVKKKEALSTFLIKKKIVKKMLKRHAMSRKSILFNFFFYFIVKYAYNRIPPH